MFDKSVDFFLELKQLLREKMRVLYVGLVLDNLKSAIQNVGVHLLDDQTKRGCVTFEHLVEQLEFFKVFLCEHVDASGVLTTHSLSHLCDEL